MPTAAPIPFFARRRADACGAAGRDAMTGCWTRSAMRRIAEPMARQAGSPSGYLAVLWLDLDRFQRINHALGHAAGDRVIEAIATRIRLSALPGGELIRMGNDEFVALIPNCTHRRAVLACRVLLREVRKPLCTGADTVRLSASVGLALWRDGEDMLSVLARADRARSVAKTRGGDRIAYAEGADDAGAATFGARERLLIENTLHEALEADALGQAYQPVVSATGEVEAIEALVRCERVGGRTVAPVSLVRVAEESGLISRLGRWALGRGLACARRLARQGTPTKVAVNVSRLQIASAQFIPILETILAQSPVPASLLELELTESAFIDCSSIVRANLRRVREAGIALAIDDFGTGYSSLSSLRDMPATKIKLDASFTRRLPGDARSFSIVSSVARLAHDLGITVVAEGIETTEQAVAMLAAGVDAFQGFHFAPPMPERDLSAWMARRAPLRGAPA